MFGILEEVHNLGNLDFGLGETCDILESHLAVVVLVKKPRFGLADAEDAASSAPGTTHSPQQEEPQSHEQHNGAEGVQNHRQVVTTLDILHFSREDALLAPGLDIVVKLVGTGNLSRDLIGRGACRHAKGTGRGLGRLPLEHLLRHRIGQQCFGLVLAPIDRD